MRGVPKWLKRRFEAAIAACARTRFLTCIPARMREQLLAAGPLSSAFFGCEVTALEPAKLLVGRL
eukprot:gene9706-3361_t